MPLGMQCVEIGLRRQDETLVLEHFRNQFRVVAVLLLVSIVVVLPHIRDVFQKEHRQYIVFVDGRIDGAAKDIAGFPDGAIDDGLFEGAFAHVRCQMN